MPEYLAPGVYTEEISSGPVPIEGVSTSTAGFVGLTERGPTAVRLSPACATSSGGTAARSSPRPRSYLPSPSRASSTTAVSASSSPGEPQRRGRHARPGHRRRRSRARGHRPRQLDGRLFVRVSPAAACSRPTRPRQPTPDPSSLPTQVLYLPRRRRRRSWTRSTAASSRNPDRREPDASEDWDNLTGDPLSSDYVVNRPSSRSSLATAPAERGPTAAVADWTPLADGSHGRRRDDRRRTTPRHRAAADRARRAAADRRDLPAVRARRGQRHVAPQPADRDEIRTSSSSSARS